jgi:hypothetical protein
VGEIGAQAEEGAVKSAGRDRVYPFTIVTGVLGDFPAVSMQYSIQRDRGTISIPVRFDLFIQHAIQEGLVNYPETLQYLFPMVTKTSDTSDIEVGSIPQIRPAYVPAWFPVADFNQAVIRIGTVMARTRTKPLVIKFYIAAGGKVNNPRAVLLATDTIPFPITIMSLSKGGSEKIAPWISVLPGEVTHTCASVEYRGSAFDAEDLVGPINYAVEKKIIIKRLALSPYMKGPGPRPTQVFTDVVLTVKNGLEDARGVNSDGTVQVFFDRSFKWSRFLIDGMEKGKKNLVDFSLKHTIAVNYQDKQTGNTALHVACTLSNLDVVNELIKRGADINMRNKTGDTPLQIARDQMALGPTARNSVSYDIKQQIVEILLGHGAQEGINLWELQQRGELLIFH